MTGLREHKKAATRAALARAAAEIALTQGPEALTVAAISARAGVSPRTFHNYFTSREEALREFIDTRVRALTAGLDELPAELDALAAVERFVIDHLRSGESELDSFGGLIRVCGILEAVAPGMPELHTTMAVRNLLPRLLSRMPGRDTFEAMVSIQVIAAAVKTAITTFYATPEPRDPEEGVDLVRRACRLLREW